jgi:hypothetical protein
MGSRISELRGNANGFLAARDVIARSAACSENSLVLLDAAVARHVWLPGNDVTGSYDPTHAYWLLLLVAALGLSLVREGCRDEAVAALGRAHDLAPGDSRFAFVYAVALHDTDQRARAT